MQEIILFIVVLLSLWKRNDGGGKVVNKITTQEYYENLDCSGDPIFIRVQYSDMCMTPTCVMGVKEVCGGEGTDTAAKMMPGQLLIYSEEDPEESELLWLYGWKAGCYSMGSVFKKIECFEMKPFVTEWVDENCEILQISAQELHRSHFTRTDTICP